MIIELERYNEIGALLIENRTTGFQRHICNWNRGQRVSVTKEAVNGGGRDGDVNRVKGCIQLASESGMRIGMHRTAAVQSKKY